MGRMRGIGRYPADDIDAVSRRVIEFQQQQMRLFETCGAPTRFRVKSSTRVIREVIHAFSAAPFALARRAAGMAGARLGAALPPPRGGATPPRPRVPRPPPAPPPRIPPPRPLRAPRRGPRRS